MAWLYATRASSKRPFWNSLLPLSLYSADVADGEEDILLSETQLSRMRCYYIHFITDIVCSNNIVNGQRTLHVTLIAAVFYLKCGENSWPMRSENFECSSFIS